MGDWGPREVEVGLMPAGKRDQPRGVEMPERETERHGTRELEGSEKEGRCVLRENEGGSGEGGGGSHVPS